MSSVLVALATAVPIALGLLIVSRGAQRRIGWLLVAHGTSVGLLLGSPAAPSSSRAGMVTDQLTQGIWILLFLWLVLIAYLLPDGQVASRLWRRWLRAGLGGAAVFVVGAAGDASGFRGAHGGKAPPVPWLPEQVADGLGLLGLALVVLLFFGSALSVRSRLRRAEGEERLRLLWPVWGAAAVPLGLLVLWANRFVLGGYDWLTVLILTGVSIALPLTIAIAILRHRLFDIQLVLSRTLTYGALILGVGAVYGLVLLATERLTTSSSAAGLIAVALVAVSTHPAYSWLRLRVERWVYGYRSEPHRALRLLADRTEAAEPAALSGSITAAVAEALRLDHVWIESRRAAGHGRGVVRTPLVHRGERLGALAVQVPAGRQLSSADLALLRDLARYAAVLVKAEQQGALLQESRTRIVAGREEERRLLRRDLHDGVGPSLAAIVLKLDAARSRSDDAERLRLLAEARDEVRGAIAEVRRVVDDLRPAAIDEVGLLSALRQRAARLSGDLVIEVAGPEPMPPLPAAVEVAAFHIASEAITNAVRHAAATRCQVTLALNGAFELTVADNGRGTDGNAAAGVGWTSMCERAAELGGSCTIASRPEGGLLVRAVIPLEPERVRFAAQVEA